MNEETEKIITGDANRIPSPERPVLRTMKSDMQEYINQQKISIVDIAGKQAKKQGLKISENYDSGPNKFIVLAVIALLLASVGVFTYVILLKKDAVKEKSDSQTKFPVAIISSDKQEFITLNADDAQNNKSKINEIIMSDIGIGNIANFIFIDMVNNIITPELFFRYLDINTSLGFSSFLTDKFMFGVYGTSKNEPFIIFKISSFENIFAIMLKWEKTIISDISEIMTVSNIPLNTEFQDKIIKNHDARVLYDENGKIIMLYSFLDKDTLIITTSDNTFEEILRRKALSSI